MTKMIKIGNTQAFWGDSASASATLLQQQPDLDYLTLDYLAEVSLSIMAAQKAKDPAAGYARDFIDVVKSLVPYWKKGAKVKIITNAGGLDPKACALACAEVLQQASCPIRLGIVTGDHVIEKLKAEPATPSFNNLETKEPLSVIFSKLTTANAYLGAKPLVEALKRGADIVITGRVADPSLTVAPCAFHFNWPFDAYDRLAQATIAGHLIECGTQVTGGISTNWLDLPDPANIGFPIVEIEKDGTFIVTKPMQTGGRVCLETVKEQLLYEIGNPDEYLSPDATVSFLSLSLEDAGSNRIRVIGGKGKPPPPSYKVSATYRDGFKAEAMLAMFGRDICKKAHLSGEIVLERVRRAGFVIERSCIECLGCGDVVPRVSSKTVIQQPSECVLRICVIDRRREALECFAREIAPLVTSGPQGTTGYATGRPHIRPVFGYWPCLIATSVVTPMVEMIEVK